jgi:Tol biopolymer transport system component/predicted Ser/Thr protein kinase
MSITTGTRIGVYEITALLGEGGMGQVYRARDTKLARDVALKVLPESFAGDPDRLMRFEREAKTLASLNHPNIAAIYGIEERALVMELVDGEDLSTRIAHGPIPIDEVLPIAKQIAEALEAAHEQGIIHRDLKPANIKVRPDGTVKVLDFGLAKAMALDDPGVSSLNQTVTSPAMTIHGVILGTAAYMSPEQAAGKPVDRRSDIWAFGVVLFEMLSGRRVFDGETVSHVLASVLKDDPDWTTLPANTPAAIRKLLRRCLQKDRRQRLADVSDARLEIADAMLAPEAVAAPVAEARANRTVWMLAAVAGVALIAAGIPAVQHLSEAPAAALPETRLEISTPSTPDPLSLAISPDGRNVVFVASGDGAARLWMRPLDSITAQPLAGTEGASFPFWSPDSRSIGYISGQQLKRLDLGGSPRTIASGAGRGGTWNAAGVILFSNNSGSLSRVDAAGGTAAEIATIGRNPRHPMFLPDGRHFIFYGAKEAADTQGIYVADLDTGESTRLTEATTAGVYLSVSSANSGSSDWLLWVRSGSLVAQRFDIDRQTLTGEPLTIVEGVAFDDGSLNVPAVSVAASGALAYRSGGLSRRELRWFDRNGKAIGALGAPEGGGLQSPRLSPDGRRVAVARVIDGNTDVWTMDGVRTSRVTFEPGADNFPVWARDHLSFRSNRSGAQRMYIKPSAGGDAERLLLDVGSPLTTSDWSADHRWMLYMSQDPESTFDLWLQPTDPAQLAAAGQPRVFLKTPFAEKWGRFSPDGRWVAYHSNESGQFEVYVRTMLPAASATATTSAGGGQWQVSTTGGTFPVWGPKGRTLYYANPAGTIMQVSVASAGGAFEAGPPVALFQPTMFGGGTENGQGPQYDVARDGRFLVNTVLEETVAAPIVVIQNWRPR